MTTTPTKPRRGRTAVPAVDAAASATSPGLDALTTSDGRARFAFVDVDLIDPDPHNPEHRSEVIDEELAASIARDGVLTPLLLRPNTAVAGRFFAIAGHRRKIHARHVGLTEVPAMVLPERTDLEALRALLVENIHRQDLRPSEEAHLVQGLLDLGVDESALAGEVHRSASWVRARRALGRLPETVRAKVDTRQATLDDALALASFDGPEDLRDHLVKMLGEPGFAHEVEQARQTAVERERVAELRAGLEVDGVTVVESLDEAAHLHELSATAPRAGSGYPASLTPEEHEACPGHVAAIVTDFWGGPPKVLYGCSDWKGNGHHKRFGSSSSSSVQSTEERREVIANNKAAAAAEVVRRQWISDLLKRSKMPGDAAVYVARIVHPSGQPNFPESEIARSLLYGKQICDRDVDEDRAKRPMHHLVALAAARVEASMPKDFWRADWDSHRVHLEQLAAWGYELADVEREYLVKAAKAKGRRSS
jgi:ParB family chromosome partitioning protein